MMCAVPNRAADPADLLVREAVENYATCEYHGINWYEECEECEEWQATRAALDSLIADLSAARGRADRLEQALEQNLAAGVEEQKLRDALHEQNAALDSALRRIAYWPFDVNSDAAADLRHVKGYAHEIVAAAAASVCADSRKEEEAS